MAVKIKLKRIGKTRTPQYRIVVSDARTARGGRSIEEIGIYQPRREPSLIRLDSERAQYWLGVGAQPTEPVLAILKVTGDWQKFRGEPGAEGTLKDPQAKPDKRARFAEALRAAESAGTAAKPKALKPQVAPAAEEAAAEAPASDEAAPAAADAPTEAAEETPSA